MLQNLSGKIALITGAAQGMGLVFAKALAAEGAVVALTDLEAPKTQATEIEANGGQALGVSIDVSSEISVNQGFSEVADKLGKVDILINNAGLFSGLQRKSLCDISVKEFDRVMAVNVRGPFLCSRAAARQMSPQKYGKIVNIASATVFKGTPFFTHYVASKGAIIAMTRALSKELGEVGIRVNAVAVGLVMTDNVVANSGLTKELLKPVLASRALKREQNPDDVTGAVIFLSSPQSDFITGQTLVVDGGSVTH